MRVVRLDPGLHRLAVLGTNGSEHDEGFDLREHVLRDDCGALRYERSPESARSTTAHNVVDRTNHSLLAADDSLRNKGVCLVDDEVERLPVAILALAVVELLQELGHELSLLRLREVSQTQDT